MDSEKPQENIQSEGELQKEVEKEVDKEVEVEEEKGQLTPELVQELMTLLEDPKLQVKYGALNAILQYTQNKEDKKLFLETDIFKILVGYIDMPQMTKICLSTMIHFSSSEDYAVKLVDYIYPIIMKMRDDSGLIEQLGLLLLLNVSKETEFAQKILEKREEGVENVSKLSPMVLQILFGFMESKPTRRWVIANIFVNVSASEAGREYVATEKLYLRFIKYLNDESDALRLASLRILRNVVFLWQNQEIVVEILKKQNEIIDRIAIHMLTMLIKSNLVHQIQPCKELLLQSGYKDVVKFETEIQPHLENMKTTKQKSIYEIELCVDIIIVLSNSGFPDRKPVFHMNELKKVIAQLNFTKISEETKDKLEALETFCFW